MSEPLPRPVRDAGVDAVKAAAIFCVVALHVSADGLSAAVGSLPWLCALLWSCAVRAGVPLFFLCSGALLLAPEKDLPLGQLWGKNILRIVAAMLVWALLYKLLRLLPGGAFSAGALWQAVKEVLVFKQEFHLYYLHILLLVYALLPLTRVFVRHASEREMRYALLAWFALGIVFPTLRSFWPLTLLTDIPLQWMLNMTYAAVGYGLLGRYLTSRLPPARLGAALTVAGFALVFVPTACLSLRAGALEQRFLEGMSVGVCLLAAGLFSLLYRAGRALAGRRLRAVTTISRASFCIYLVHVAWLELFRGLGLTPQALHALLQDRLGLGPAAVSPLLTVPLLTLAIAALSFLCWCILSRIPLVNKWLI